MIKVRTALISVYDKEGLEDFARGLAELGIRILSTGGTHSRLVDANIPVTSVSEVTGFPEILRGQGEKPPPKDPRGHPGLSRDSSGHGGFGSPWHRPHRSGGGESLSLRGHASVGRM